MNGVLGQANRAPTSEPRVKAMTVATMSRLIVQGNADRILEMTVSGKLTSDTPNSQ